LGALRALGAAAKLLGTAAELPGCHEFFFLRLASKGFQTVSEGFQTGS